MSKEQQYIIVAIVVVLGGFYAYWNYLLKPTMDKIVKNQQKYSKLVSQIEKAEKQARRLPALKSQKERLEKELGKLEKQLPKKADMPNILRTITREAMREDMDFSRIVPKKPSVKTYFESIPFTLSIKGELHGFVRFLSSMGQQERIFQASNITLRPAGKSTVGSKTELSIELQMETYAYRG